MQVLLCITGRLKNAKAFRKNTVSACFEERKISEPGRMFLMSGYVLIICVLVKSGFLLTFKRDFSQKGWTFSPTAKLKIRPFSKGCRESGTNLMFLHRWGGKVDSRRFVMVVWNERCPFSCFWHFFGFGCHNHSNSLPMYVALARRWSPVELCCAFAAFFDVPLRSWWEA